MSFRSSLSRRSVLALGALVGTGALTYSVVKERQKPLIITADYPDFATMADLIRASQEVVVAQYLSSREELLYPEASSEDIPQNPQRGRTLSSQERAQMAVPITVSRVRVRSILKGRLSATDEIEVSQTGGTLDGSQVREASTPLLGEFASRVPHGSFLLALVALKGRYGVLNPQLGIYGVDEHGTLLQLDPATRGARAIERKGGFAPMTLGEVQSLV